IESSLVLVSVDLLAAACFLLEIQMPTATATSTPTATIKPRGFMLPPLPPGRHTEADHGKGEDQHGEVEDHVPLRRVDVQRPVLRSLGPNRDQVFVGGQPVDHVQKQVAVAVEANDPVGAPVRAADDDESPATT